MNFSGKEGHPNIQPSTRPGIELGTSGLGGRDLNHCTNPSAIGGLGLWLFVFCSSESFCHVCFVAEDNILKISSPEFSGD